jgi:ribosomal protein S18 acetylase RimI-like enzyme
VLIRAAEAADLDFLERMLLAAFSWNDRDDLDPAQVLADPAISHYVSGWPATGEIGVIAVDDSAVGSGRAASEQNPEADARLGAAWLRYLPADDPGYGYVADDVPELSMAVRTGARGRGHGRALITALLDAARGAGIRKVSLSVEDGNVARRLYESVGFVPVGRNGGSDTMLVTLS